MLTPRDREIISFIDSVGWATIQNISDLYFSNNKFSYDLSRKRLKKIKEMGEYIKSFQNQETNETVYVPYNSNKKKVSIHDIMVLNYACKLTTFGCKLDSIEMEPVFNGIKPDSMVIFTIDNTQYYQLIEMQIRHNLIDLDRYTKTGVMESILSKTDGYIPRLIIIQDTRIKYSDNNPTMMEIIQMDTSMWDIGKVLKEDVS
jgi:hypothetical protein